MPSTTMSGVAPTRACIRVLLSLGALTGPSIARAQSVPLPVLAVEATPIGALPPVALPMPASRDQNYWGFRLQIGERQQRGGPEDLLAMAGGVDLQIRGGSVFGLTGGYQWRRGCQTAITGCGGHSLFGARARFSVLTGGPTLAGLWGDNDASSTLGTEVGVGYAPRVAPGLNACTLDVGLPFSIATFEVVHLVSFITPGLAWDIDCSAEGTPTRTNYLIGFGFGLQQLWFRGLDVHVGAQRIFRGASGMQFGVSVSWVRLP